MGVNACKVNFRGNKIIRVSKKDMVTNEDLRKKSDWSERYHRTTQRSGQVIWPGSVITCGHAKRDVKQKMHGGWGG